MSLFDRPQTYTTANPVASSVAGDGLIDQGLRAHMLKVYNYMTLGLIVSAISSLLLMGSLGSLFYTYGSSGRPTGMTVLGWIATFAPIGMLLVAAFVGNRMSVSATQAFFWAFVTLKGVGLGLALQLYTGVSVVRVLMITAVAFGALSLWAYTTKKDLSGFGSFLIVGLVGLLVLGIANIFIASSMLSTIITAASILIFGGLIAWETQSIKSEYITSRMQGDEATVHAVWSALNLYISVVGLFQSLLGLLGQREE
jgi:FtsH-binding integral membrane protein